MFAQILYQFGKNIYSNQETVTIPLGFTAGSSFYSIVIDEEGRLLDMVEEETKPVLFPYSVNNQKFSDYHKCNDDCPFLINEQMKTLLYKDSNRSFIYRSNIDLLCIYSSNWMFRALNKFAYQSQEFLEMITNEKNLIIDETKKFVLYVVRNGKKEQIINEKTIPILSEFILYSISLKAIEGEDYCEITGEKCSFYLKRHSRISQGMAKAKLISQTVYNNYYGGGKEKYPICNIGAETELFLNFAFFNIEKNAGLYGAKRKYYLGCFDEMQYVPLTNNIEEIAQMVGYESINSNNIDDVLEEFKRKYAGKNLFYLEFDTVNQGRISIYKMYSYSINESKKIIENMAYFYKIMTEFYFWDGDEVYCNWNLKKILNLHFSIHSSRDFARIGQRIDLFYSETISLLFAGEIQKLCGKYLFSHIRELGMTNFGLAQRLFNLQIQMKVEEEMKKEEEMKIDVSLVAGELMGYVFQLEEKCRIKDGAKKGKFFLCERYLDQFQKQPEKTWLMIRKDIQKIFARYPTDFCWLQKRIENREALLYGVCEWEKKSNLSGAVYVGFNLAKRNLEYLEEERGLRRCIIIDFC